MGFFQFKKKQTEAPTVQTVQPKDEETRFPYAVNGFQFNLPEIPVIKEVRGKDWVYYGEDNLYPQNLKKIVMLSPTQGAIIKGKAGMMAGDGLLVNGSLSESESEKLLAGLPPNVQQDFQRFLSNDNSAHSIEEILTLISTDYETYGAFAIEVVWSIDFTKIATVKYIDVSNVRCGKMVNDRVEKYYYSRDWSLCNKEGYIPECKHAFSEEDRTHYNQLIYVKNGNLEYYGEPAYIHGISYVSLEGKISNFHDSNISNAFAPSMSIKFYALPGSPEEERDTVRAIERTYKGTGNAGRAMIFFSENKESAPEVLPVPTSDLHMQYIAIQDTTKEQILTSNQVTSPLLFGVSVKGQLGGNTELATAYQIFNSSVIEPDRKKAERVINELLEINGIPLEITIMPFNPLVDTSVNTIGDPVVNALNSLSPLLATKVLETMSAEEIRNLIGLGPAKAAAPSVPTAQKKHNLNGRTSDIHI